MKLTILIDNNTYIDRYFCGEPGFSAYIETEDKKILLDLGYSHMFLDNARKMKIDLADLDYVALSHGHLDHTGGFDGLIRDYTEREFEGMPHKRPILLAHPTAFQSIAADGVSEIGSFLSEDKLARHFEFHLSKEPRWISDKLVFLGEIPRVTSFEGNSPIGIRSNKEDYCLDDTALAYKGTDGLVIITGCSHSGIANIAEYAKEICQESRIRDIVGGFHLLNPASEQLEGTCRYFENQNIKEMHPCHCTDLYSKIALAEFVEVKECGVGLSLEFR